MTNPTILVVGGADTGRAPMTAALLRRTLKRHSLAWPVASAGVVGHDGDPAQPEARDAMLALGLDLGAHVARSLSDELAAAATLLLAVDNGVGRVLRARYPAAQVATLGGLAGSPRDIPDPFRMQVGAWLQYANEIDALLKAGLPRLRAMLDPAKGGETGGQGASEAGVPNASTGEASLSSSSEARAARVAAAERVGRLLSLVAELPDVVDWASGSRQIAAELAPMEQPLAPGDLARPYVALLRAAFALLPGRPSPAQAVTLRSAVGRLRAPINAPDLDALSGELATLA